MSIDRQQILDCACDLYLEDGLEGFSMRQLARCVGVTAPALYRHYESREAVLLDVVGEAYKLLSQYLYRALAGDTPRERMRRAGMAYLDFALENPRLYEALYIAPEVMGVQQLPGEVGPGACGQFWKDRVLECLDAGLYRPDDPERIGTTLWGLAHGLISIYLRGLLPIGPEEFREVYAGSFLRALRGLGTDDYVAELEAGDLPTPSGESAAD